MYRIVPFFPILFSKDSMRPSFPPSAGISRRDILSMVLAAGATAALPGLAMARPGSQCHRYTIQCVAG
jgi:hypothetical protein